MLVNNTFEEPQSDSAVMSVEGDINIFAGGTEICTIAYDVYPDIMDEPEELEVESDDNIWKNLAIGAVATLALAGAAVLVAATGGAALAVFALAGAALGTGVVTGVVTYKDSKSGKGRDTSQFIGQLIAGGTIGAITGAGLYLIGAAIPYTAQAAGVQASMWLGGTSEFTAITVPMITKGAGAALMVTNGALGMNRIYESASGENVLADTVFSGNTQNYEDFEMLSSSLGLGYYSMGSEYARIQGVNIENQSLGDIRDRRVRADPRYFDQETGEEIWPGQRGDTNTDGFVEGKYAERDLHKGSEMDRYGGNNGTFFGKTGTPIRKRAMSPNSDFNMYNQYVVKKDIPVREGKIAPWFGRPGGGTQYKLDPTFVEDIKSKLRPGESLIDGLIRMGYLTRK